VKQNEQALLLSKLNTKNNNSLTKLNKIYALQSGQHLSTLKGQGMDFAESRIYQSGDDVRHIDWRVTARTGKTHTKVFSEQKEQPLMLIIDMRKSMFFGTRNHYKSVLAAQIGSILAWNNYNEGDKTGIIIITASEALHIQIPAFSQQATTCLIKQLAKATQCVDFSTSKITRSTQSANLTQHIQQKTKGSLNKILKQINQHISAGTQIIMLSDFRGIDSKSASWFAALSKRSSLALFSISDPFEEKLCYQSTTPKITDAFNKNETNNPKKKVTLFPDFNRFLSKLLLTNGQKIISLNHQARLNYSRLLEERKQHLQQSARQSSAHLIEFSTADHATEILGKLAQNRIFEVYK
jgi:hypothetical protein